MFTYLNVLLQRDEPSIHILKLAIESLERKLADRIIQANIFGDSFTVYQISLDGNMIWNGSQVFFQ